MATVGVYELRGVHDDVATLVDTMGHRVSRVPGALVHATGALRRLRVGDAALFYTWTTPGWLGRVSRLSNNQPVQLKYDLAGRTKAVDVDHAEPLRRGVQPLAFVGFPKAGTVSMGLVLALTAERAWIRTASGHVEVYPRSAITRLDLAVNLRAGSRVRAFAWATGLQSARVVQEVERGLRYRVEIGRSKVIKDVFFARLVK